ncbi:MAG: hypothetical protein QOD65_4131 [Gaiellales bacterium]|nr:hypothetical protein [Gaiellales bacterium]
MNRMLKRPVIVGALIGASALVGLILAISLTRGSGSPGSTPPPHPVATTTSGRSVGGNRPAVSAAQGWHDLAQCFRSHGYAIADPIVNATGTSSWSSSTGPPPTAVRNATRAVGETTCQAEFRALPAHALSPPPTPAEIHGLVLFARCMRERGIVDWPDPHPSGAFPLNARLLAVGKRGYLSQMLSCKHYLPGDGISIDDPGGVKK